MTVTAYTRFCSALNFGLCINAIFTCLVHVYYVVRYGCIVVHATFQAISCQSVGTKCWWQVTRICLLEMWSDFPSAFWKMKGKIYLSLLQGKYVPHPVDSHAVCLCCSSLQWVTQNMFICVPSILYLVLYIWLFYISTVYFYLCVNFNCCIK